MAREFKGQKLIGGGKSEIGKAVIFSSLQRVVKNLIDR
jgi:hypothetical protein